MSWKLVGVTLGDLLASLFWEPLGECAIKYCPVVPAAFCTCCQTSEMIGTDEPLVCPTSLSLFPMSFINFHLFSSTVSTAVAGQEPQRAIPPFCPFSEVKLCVI